MEGTAEFSPASRSVESSHQPDPSIVRRLPVGAEVQPDGGVHFRLWAPKCQRVRVLLSAAPTGTEQEFQLSAEQGGYLSVLVPTARAGDRYSFLVDADNYRYPDPASRFQPDGPHGPSEIVDPESYSWRDSAWSGIKLAGQVLYELHLGTFTPEGTWAAAERELAELAAVGITTIEVMPVATCPGKFNWGYDGVALYAPTPIYGRPDEMRQFVDTAHQLGIGVILDVVYNHLGPDGNYLSRFSDTYFSKKKNDWGDSINFDGPGSAGVREFFVQNAGYWIDEFHLDGLRLDATQDIHDSSERNVIAELTAHARTKAGKRSIIVVAENEPQDTTLIRPCDRGGYGLDGAWNDDFHHSAYVASTRHSEAYYTDYRGTAQELLAACKWGYLYQGQWYRWQKKPRGRPGLDLAPWQSITFLENHDQISNSLWGKRTWQLTSPGRYRALTALLLLGPNTPLLFQGQEFGASAPFVFFADHHEQLTKQVHAGRKEFLRQFPSLATEAAQDCVPLPAADETMERCKLDFAERQKHAAVYQMHKDLLRLRREEPALRPRDERWYDGAVFCDHAFCLRYFGETPAEDRLLLINLGTDWSLSPNPEPLLAPPADRQWAVAWSSEDPQYGGSGTPAFRADENWEAIGESALWLRPEEVPHG
jgi:maltooligosyltrehalose trehalohydrolase